MINLPNLIGRGILSLSRFFHYYIVNEQFWRSVPWKTQEEESVEGATEVDILIEEVIPEGGETEVKEVETAATDASEVAQAETTDEDTAATDVVHEGGRIAWTPSDTMSEKEEEVNFTELG